MTKKLHGKVGQLLATTGRKPPEMYRATFYISRKTFEAFKAVCDSKKRPMSQVVEAFMEDVCKSR